MDIIKKEANKTLSEIAAVSESLKQLHGEYQCKIDKIKIDYTEMVSAGKARLKTLEKQLKSMMKQYKNQLFKGPDEVVTLPAGSMIYTIEKRVVRIKRMLNRLDELNRDDLVKFSRSVDWDKIEEMSDTELSKIGTRRKDFEKYSYNVAKGGNS